MSNVGRIAAGGGAQTLPEGVTQCEGLSRRLWMTKCVTLKNEAGESVGKGICHNVNLDLIIDSDSQPLGDDRVAVLTAESLSEHDVPSMPYLTISRLFVEIRTVCSPEEAHGNEKS